MEGIGVKLHIDLVNLTFLHVQRKIIFFLHQINKKNIDFSTSCAF